MLMVKKGTMTKIYLYLIILFTSILNIYCQDANNKKNKSSKINDGPYIFIEKNKLIQKEIINGKVFTKKLATNSYDTHFVPNQEVYTHVKKIAALSDIHGQYKLALKLLINNEIIDEKLNWIFGKGHLVIVGDVFDRGNKVHETLLLIYKLEHQAKNKGGRVHFLLGNHEFMILHKDLRYVSDKYLKASELLNLDYNDLYSNKTVIGRWLRSKPTIIKLNNNIFVHGGISKDFLSSNDFDIKSTNNIMRASIERDKAEMKSSTFYDIYYGRNSLIWYRGYFNDKLKNKEISQILKLTESEHIVVGHCSHKKVVSLYDDKIFGVDSSLKNGKYGELLFIKNDDYFRKTLKGKKKKFK
tara:strand:- start:2022 stop:3089 length:1068 start_codon:yes stop_codon:yes gene_type:complete